MLTDPGRQAGNAFGSASLGYHVTGLSMVLSSVAQEQSTKDRCDMGKSLSGGEGSSLLCQAPMGTDGTMHG